VYKITKYMKIIVIPPPPAIEGGEEKNYLFAG
jgi:hypothetical protein